MWANYEKFEKLLKNTFVNDNHKLNYIEIGTIDNDYSIDNNSKIDLILIISVILPSNIMLNKIN